MDAMATQADALCRSNLPWIRKRGERMRDLIGMIRSVTDQTDTYTFAMTVHIAARDADAAWRLARLAMRLPPVRTDDARYLKVVGDRTRLRKMT
jgi:hypothetical protein